MKWYDFVLAGWALAATWLYLRTEVKFSDYHKGTQEIIKRLERELKWAQLQLTKPKNIQPIRVVDPEDVLPSRY